MTSDQGFTEAHFDPELLGTEGIALCLWPKIRDAEPTEAQQ